jgi:carboxyl-terminal processing protease
MPKRNLLIICLMAAVGLLSWVARDQSLQGRRFGEVLAVIEDNCLERVDRESLFAAGVRGLVSELDANSAFLPAGRQGWPDTSLDRTAHLDHLDHVAQQFGGVGMELAIDAARGDLVVQSPLPGGPAWLAGIGPGDRITGIDGVPTTGMRLRDAVQALRGREGTTVAVEIESREGGPRSTSLVRAGLRTESVRGDRRLPDGSWEWLVEGEEPVALLRIDGFGEHTLAEFDAACAAIAAGPRPHGLILDLRGNPGGLLPVAVEICDRFLDAGVIVSTRGRGIGGQGTIDVRRASEGNVFPGVPIAVLIDGLTASAAEIVAACLQDNRRATVIGTRSFGRGTLQSIVPLSDGSGLLRLTTTEYIRPRDTAAVAGPAAEWFVSPDTGHEVNSPGQTLEVVRLWRQERDAAYPPGRASRLSDSAAGLPRHVDPTLDRALDVLESTNRRGG